MSRNDPAAIPPFKAATHVALPPDIAFEVFVEEIERWWRPGPDSWHDPARAIGIGFERGVGGRWVERYDALGDDVSLIGDLITWEPGASIGMTWFNGSHQHHGVPLEIRFELDSDGTCVTVVHGGEQFPDLGEEPDRAAQHWEAVLGWFRDWATWGSPRRIPGTIGAARAYVLQPGEGIDGDAALKTSRRSTAGRLSVVESITTGGAPHHLHRTDDEVFFVLEGTLTVTLDGTTHELGPGGTAYIPAGTPHAWDTIGEARVLIITAPGGLEEFLAGLHSWPNGYADAWRVLGERHGYILLPEESGS
jgi:quercetin dioxygenase-like cupin family protein